MRHVTISLFCAALVGGGTIAAGAVAPPAAMAKAMTSAPAIAAGYGYQFAGVGAHASYFLQVGERLRVVPYAGGGYLYIDESRGRSGFAVGTMVQYGERHRVFADVNYGLAAVEAPVVFVSLRPRTIYGVTAAAGYEWLDSTGVFVRPSVGATVYTTTPAAGESRLAPTLGIAVGFKVW